MDYSGNVIDTVRYPTETDEFYWINGQSQFYGMFKNNQDEIMGIFRHYPDNSQLELYHNTLVHFDDNLNITSTDTLWNFSNETERFDRVENSLETQDSSYLISGHTVPIINEGLNDVDGFMAKINPETGDSIWHQEYPDLFSIHKIEVQDPDHIWAIAGKRFSGQPEYEYVLLKMDNEGNILKSREFGGEGGEGEFPSVNLIVEEDRILVGGLIANDPLIEEIGPERGTYTTIIFEETDNSFEQVELKRYGYNGNYQQVNGFFPVEEDSTYMLYGYYRVGETNPWQQGYVMNLSHEMDSLWSRSYIKYENQESDHFLRYFKPAPDGGYVGCGYIENSFFDPFFGIEQLWLFRTDEYGCLEPGCQDVNVEEITIGLENVMSVYPNPARDRVTVEFDFPKNYSPPNSGEFRLMSTDGREVLRKEVGASTFSSSMQLDVSSLQSGVYILHWTDGKKWFDSVRIVVE